MADFTVREGDSFTIADTLEDVAGAAIDIEGATIQFMLTPADGGTAKIDAAALNDQAGDGSDGTKGKVSYTSTAGDSDTAGVYLGSWTVTFGDGSTQTFPNGGYILVEVTADTPVAAATRFADSTDLEDLLGIDFTADEHIRANRLLARASGRIQAAVKQRIALITDDTYTRPGTTDKRITLPELPVVSVESVAIDGDTISDWYLAGNAIVRSGTNLVERVLIDGVVDGGYRWGAGFGYEQQTLTIVYTHGYADIPEVCRSIALEMVKRVWVNPGGVIQETIADTQTTYAPYAEPPRGLALTGSERRELRRFFGSNAGAVWTGTAP